MENTEKIQPKNNPKERGLAKEQGEVKKMWGRNPLLNI